ncbi:TRAP transporter small permease [Cognatishimia sp.]|uniref:TRAP transporter small permease n=1 Tax=Cognatishimia sp. TaxID=2211648 RepID=UPI0035179BFE
MLGRFETLLLALAALAVFAMGLIISVNVVLRLFGVSLPDSVVIVQELMVLAIILPLAVVTRLREHVSVEVVSNLMPGGWQRWLRVLGWIVGLFALGVLTWAGTREFLKVWESGSFYFGDLSLPKWPGRLAFAVGMAAAVLRLLLVLKDDLLGVMKD